MTEPRKVVSGQAGLATWRRGSGDPVVFLHAGVADSRMWAHQSDAIADRRATIAYDRRGFGETRAAPEDYSSVRDLMAVLDASAAGQPAVLVGASQGGKVAIDAALTHPERVRALVMVAPSVSGAPGPNHPPAITQLLSELDAAEESGDLDQVNEIEARLWLDGPLAPAGRVGGEARALFLAMNGIALRAGDVGKDQDSLGAYGRLGELPVPALLIYGDLDFPHIQERCRRMARILPNAKVHALTGAAHLPALEQPAAVSRMIVEFLDDMPKRGR